MIGAIIGDICGSRFEWANIKTTAFSFFHPDCRPTDDSVMTLAVAAALLEAEDTGAPLEAAAVRQLQAFGRRYPRAGYGGRFARWLQAERPRPYQSFGNGAAMRVSAVGWAAKSEAQVKALANAVTAVTHDHPEALLAAEAVAMSIFLARNGADKETLRRRFSACFPLDFTLDEIRPRYGFHVDCKNSVPEAMEAFLEADSFEQAIRLAVSVGGDSDTIAAIAGSVAEAYFGVPDGLRRRALEFLDPVQRQTLAAFENRYPPTRKEIE